MSDEKEKIHTHRLGDPGDTIGKLCQCHECGIVRRHDPLCDFYTRPEDLIGRLLCEPCLIRLAIGDSSRLIEVDMDETIMDEDDPADWWKKGEKGR